MTPATNHATVPGQIPTVQNRPCPKVGITRAPLFLQIARIARQLVPDHVTEREYELLKKRVVRLG
jgi:hypothetical protein